MGVETKVVYLIARCKSMTLMISNHILSVFVGYSQLGRVMGGCYSLSSQRIEFHIENPPCAVVSGSAVLPEDEAVPLTAATPVQ